MTAFVGSSSLKPSKDTVNRSRQAPFGKLAIDTGFARHQHQGLQQTAFPYETKTESSILPSYQSQPSQQTVFPYETKTGDLTFIAIDDARARLRTNFKRGPGAQEPLHPGAKRSATLVQQTRQHEASPGGPHIAQGCAAALCETTPMLSQGRLTAKPSLRTRMKKLRPSPLDLTRSVAPSHRIVPVGAAVTSRFSADTKSPTTAGTQYHGYGQDASPPAIIITPAKEDFEADSLEKKLASRSRRRYASSIYSRRTDCLSVIHQENAPPVPPLPSFASPSPRQSRGWWNIITSPFSAPFSAMSGASFWRSPSIREEDCDQLPILSEAAAIGSTNPHAGVIFLNRSEDDDELRSAPASGPSSSAFHDYGTSPRRSNSAPGILGLNEPEFNIYQIPPYGEAAAYFNPHRNFPSLVLSPAAFAESSRGLPDGWSPSQSVASPEQDKHASTSLASDVPLSPLPHPSIEDAPTSRSLEPQDGAARPGPIETGRGIFSSPVEYELEPNETPQATLARSIFSSPAEHELKTNEIPQAQPARSFTHATDDSLTSPFSASPVVEDAHIATAFGPQSSLGEQREVDIAQARTPTPAGLALGAHTMSHDNSANEQIADAIDTSAEAPADRPHLHARQDSYGLGISGTAHGQGPSPPELPPPPSLSEKHTLALDKFGQLEIRALEEGDPKSSVPWYRRYLWTLISSGAVLMMLMVILLVLFVVQGHKDMTVEAQWLRLSGFPPLPTGVTTVIQPRNTVSQNRCVAPAGLWSCAAPVDQQTDEPNFRFEIRFRNGTLPSNETTLVTSPSSRARRNVYPPTSHSKRSTWTNFLYSSNPSPPSEDDQSFLGLTTDNASMPYNGEETPFWISLLDATALVSASLKAQKRGLSNYTYPYPDSTENSSKNASTTAPSAIPPPFTASNGAPVPQLLYPLAAAQPLRLFNRGQASEHYGFYTYFDRTVYVAGNGSSNSTNSSSASNSSAAVVSNVPLANASAVCTWSQSRLLVQIWTRRANASDSSVSAALSGNSSTSAASVPAANSTANDMRFPGSFPYPVTVTVDRHGGAAASKGVYCYGLDAASHTVRESVKTWIAEDRGAGGALVHAAEVPGSNATAAGMRRRDGGGGAAGATAGGVDGGTGGCACQWQNW